MGGSGRKGEKLFISMPRHRKPETNTEKRPGLDIQATTIKNLMRVLEDILITERVIALERYYLTCKQRKNESLEQFQADLVELASGADCGPRRRGVRRMFTAQMHHDKIAGKLLAETRSPPDAYIYAIRKKVI